MKAQGTGGAIVATSSISALVGGGMQTHYTPTKAGVHSLMQSCAIALGPYGIRCNSVMPGTIATDLNAEDLADDREARVLRKAHSAGTTGRARRRRAMRDVPRVGPRALCDRRIAAGRWRPVRQPSVNEPAEYLRSSAMQYSAGSLSVSCLRRNRPKPDRLLPISTRQFDQQLRAQIVAHDGLRQHRDGVASSAAVAAWRRSTRIRPRWTARRVPRARVLLRTGRAPDW